MLKFCARRARRSLGLVIFVIVLSASSTIQAQGVLSDLFGFVISPQPPKARVYTPRTSPVRRSSLEAPPRRRRASYGRGYRTICVRLCDGYFFPINQSTKRRNFHRDAELCQSRCVGETKLFYTPRGAPDIKRAVDMSGLAYKNMANAFLYKKRIVRGCFCRAKPWSPQERARHRMYAWEAEQKAHKERRERLESERQAVIAFADIEHVLEAGVPVESPEVVGRSRRRADRQPGERTKTVQPYAPPSKWAHTPRRQRYSLGGPRRAKRPKPVRRRARHARIREKPSGGNFGWPGDN